MDDQTGTEMILAEPFKPPFYLKNPHLQTFLARSGLRALGRNDMVSAARLMILETTGGVRLLGAFSPQQRRPAKGLVILIHGWEGSAGSTYMRTTGRLLYRNGYDVFRLNLRDHGNSHHLNKGLFFATLLDEVFQAVQQAAGLAKGVPVFLVGFSLGGNYALRIAKRCTEETIGNLRHVISISPVLDPDKATDKIDADPVILRYFLKKWTRSLNLKQQLFPEQYNFTEALRFRSLRKITDMLVPNHTEFNDSKAYFRAYSLLGDALAPITVPTTIITAADDPIIPVTDFHRLRLNPETRLIIHRYGGHMGFIEGPLAGCWHERKMVELFDRMILSDGFVQ